MIIQIAFLCVMCCHLLILSEVAFTIALVLYSPDHCVSEGGLFCTSTTAVPMSVVSSLYGSQLAFFKFLENVHFSFYQISKPLAIISIFLCF